MQRHSRSRKTALPQRSPFFESLEPRLLLTGANPAIALTMGNDAGSQDLVVMNSDGTNQTVIYQADLVAQSSRSPDLNDDSTDGYQGVLAFATNGVDYAQKLMLIDVAVFDGVPQGSNVRTFVDARIDLSRPASTPCFTKLFHQGFPAILASSVGNQISNHSYH